MIRHAFGILLFAAVALYWAGLIVFLESDPEIAKNPQGEFSRGLPPRSDNDV